MFVTNRVYANLLVYTFKEMCYLDVPRDKEFITKMIESLEKYYNDYLRPALLEHHLYKNYGNCFLK